LANPVKTALIGAAIGAAAGALVIIRDDWGLLGTLDWMNAGARILGGALGVGAISGVVGYIVGLVDQRGAGRHDPDCRHEPRLQAPRAGQAGGGRRSVPHFLQDSSEAETPPRKPGADPEEAAEE
jgi:hypothetical protein